jgi:alpha-galactosidase
MAWLQDLADICAFRAVSDPPQWLSPDELEAMTGYLSRTPSIERRGRYQFTIDGRHIDFEPAVDGRDGQASLDQWGGR